MNTTVILGNIGRDPEIKQTKDGKNFYTFSLASTIRDKGANCTMWYKCSLFDYNEKFMSFIKKGSAVVINGAIGLPRIYQDKQGESKVSLDVVVNSINFSPFGRDKKEDNQSSYSNQGVQQGQNNQRAVPMDDTDLPF